MEAIYLLVPIALILVAIGVAVFFWAVKSDQFDDLEGPAHSILFDDDEGPNHTRSSRTSTKKNEPDKDKAEP